MSTPEDSPAATSQQVHYVVTEGYVVRRAGSAVVPDAATLQGLVGDGFQQVDEEVADPKAVYWKGGLRHKGPAPTEFHTFDFEAEQWIEPPQLTAARAMKAELVMVERDRRIVEPIDYDGKRVDADTRAQSNIGSKLSELAAREAADTPMPAELLVWRDADNITHTFPNAAAYKAWLQGLTVAIAQRATEAYAWSWQKKAELDALPDLASILAFDPMV